MQDDDLDLDEQFPLGDGTADDSADVTCPYCGEPVSIAVDAGSGDEQQYVEDCEVCCNPWQVTVRFVGGTVDVHLSTLDT